MNTEEDKGLLEIIRISSNNTFIAFKSQAHLEQTKNVRSVVQWIMI